MHWLYILRNPSINRYYIGSTSNLERRLKEHLHGKTRTTRILNINVLVYKEEFATLTEARLREKKLKSYKSRKYIEWLINQVR